MLRFVVRRLHPARSRSCSGSRSWSSSGSGRCPGGPAEALLGERATPEAIAAIDEQYGLDEPIYEQYWRYLKTVGAGRPRRQRSRTRRPVTDEIKRALPGDDRAGARGDALRDRRSGSRSASSRRSATARSVDHASLFVVAARDLDPDLLPRDHPQVRLRRAARAGSRPSGGSDVLIDARAPDELLHPRRDHRAATGRRSGTRSST